MPLILDPMLGRGRRLSSCLLHAFGPLLINGYSLCSTPSGYVRVIFANNDSPPSSDSSSWNQLSTLAIPAAPNNTYQRDHIIQQMRLTHHHPRSAFVVDMRDVHMKVVCHQLAQRLHFDAQ